MADENPILNNPYEEPQWHYATNLQGELDYSHPVKGRRVFTPEIQSIPVRQGRQADLMELNEIAAADHGSHVVNLLRREVGAWRQTKYPQTTRITRELLQFWFHDHIRDKLPKAGRKTAKARAKAEGKKLVEAPPRLPETLQAALKQFYEHYKDEYEPPLLPPASQSDQLLFEDSPPVFIVVCNNTSVSGASPLCARISLRGKRTAIVPS